jgi:DNA-binding IclR family transcriptional regulator
VDRYHISSKRIYANSRRLVKLAFWMWTAVLDTQTASHYPPAVAVAPDKGVEGPRSASAGVQATLRVLDLLAARGPLQLSELARELTVAKSTIHRICTVLVERGWAVRDADGRYSLGIRALRLGSRASELPIVTAFRTVAAMFLNEVDETITLAVLDGHESLYIAMEETSQPVRYVTHVGRKTPAYASASGRVVLAHLPRETVEALFAGRPLITPTRRRLGGVAELGAILDDVVRHGYAENWEETAPGLYAASVPIVNSGGTPLAALTTLVPVSRVSGERREAILAALHRAGTELSELVSWLPAFSARSE